MGEIAEYLAKNLLSLRKSRNLTQAGLAKLAGLPRSTLTHMESGEGNPSLKSLSAIAEALGVGLETLIAEPRTPFAFIPAAKIPQRLKAHGAARIFKLLPDPIPGMEMDRMELAPGARFAGSPHLAGTKEYLTCIEGSLSAAVNGVTHHLSPGDVLAFPGNVAHSYANPGKNIAIALSVVVIEAEV